MNDPRHLTPGTAHHPSSHPSAVPQGPHAPHPPPPRAPAVVPPVAPSGRPSIAPIPTLRPQEADLDPIALVEDEPTPATPTAPPVKKIKAFGVDEHRAQHEWKRQTVRTGTGACRVRSFHGKYSEQGLEYLDNVINEWLDSHPEVEVKFVTSTVMTFEGKIREPALVLNVWY